MALTKEIILLEYFTAKSCFKKKNNKIFKEAQKLSDSVILTLLSNEKIKKIHVIRNYKPLAISDKRVCYHNIEKGDNLEDLIKSINVDTIILIAPESEGNNIKIAKKLKKFNLLLSDLETLKIFSSKKKTYQMLTKKGIPVVQIEKKITRNSNDLFLTKPIFGAGSENITITKLKKNHIINKNVVVQKFFPDTKGSFTMLCKKKEAIVLSCSEQITEIQNKKLYQKGIITGGLEKDRKKFQLLAQKITENFPGLFGFIGVDVVKIFNKWHVIEINARFTSSLLGIRQAYGVNAIKKISDLYLKRKIDKKKTKLKNKVKVFFN